MSLFDRFAQSPFVPLNEHMVRVKACVALVEPMFQRVKAGDYAGLDEIVKEVFKREHEADKLKTEIRQRIPREFDLPIFRGDLLAYLTLQDDMGDAVEDLAVLLTLKNLTMPAALAADIMDLVQKVLDVCEHLFRCADPLSQLVEADFLGERVKRLHEIIDQAEAAEWEEDKTQYAVSKKLFAMESSLGPVDVMLWSQIFVKLGDLANYADKTAERLRRMLMR